MGEFPELLNKNGFNNNWLLVPANFKNSDNLFNVLKLSRKENKSRFNFIYSSLDIMSWFEILKDYIIIFIKAINMIINLFLTTRIKQIYFHFSQLTFYHLLEELFYWKI